MEIFTFKRSFTIVVSWLEVLWKFTWKSWTQKFIESFQATLITCTTEENYSKKNSHLTIKATFSILHNSFANEKSSHSSFRPWRVRILSLKILKFTPFSNYLCQISLRLCHLKCFYRFPRKLLRVGTKNSIFNFNSQAKCAKLRATSSDVPCIMGQSPTSASATLRPHAVKLTLQSVTTQNFNVKWTIPSLAQSMSAL